MLWNWNWKWTHPQSLASTRLCFRTLQQPTAHSDISPDVQLKLMQLVADKALDQHSTKATTTETKPPDPSPSNSRHAATVVACIGRLEPAMPSANGLTIGATTEPGFRAAATGSTTFGKGRKAGGRSTLARLLILKRATRGYVLY